MRAGIRSRPWAGLDIGSFSVKLFATQSGVTGPRYWLAETPIAGPDSNSAEPPSAETVARAVAKCMQLAGHSPRGFRGVTLGIAGSDVIVKQISLPLLEEDEVAAALRFEARKHLPFDPQGMVIDYQVLGRYPSERKLDLLLAAVSNEHVERHLEPLRLLGLDADILDATPLALTNALAHVNAPMDARVLLDIGNTSSHLTLYQRGEPYFSRRLDFGGRNLTAAIAAHNQVPLAEAEEWKLAAGADDPTLRIDWEFPEMRAMLDCLRDDLVDELRRSLAFYRTLGRLPEPLTLWISGGSARLPGLDRKLGELLGHPVMLFNPVESLEGEAHGTHPSGGPQFAQAFGLALRTA